MQKQTTMIKPSEINRKWYVIDATDVVLGRLGTLVGSIIQAKTNQLTHQTLIQVIMLLLSMHQKLK